MIVVVAFLASWDPTTMTNGPCFNNLRALPCASYRFNRVSSTPGHGLPGRNPEFPYLVAGCRPGGTR
jgi:hypothetical protein